MAVISYKCPNCGGDLRFDPETQKYKCEYCVSLFQEADLDTPDQPKAEEQSAKELEKTQESTQEWHAAAYSCPSCGAEIIVDETTAASFCYYCHNPVVLQGRLEGKYLPEKVIPFKVTKDEFIQEFFTYVKKKKFIPSAFFQKDQIEKVSGVYFPYWICDEELYGTMDAKATSVRVYRLGDIEYTETKYYDIEREGNIEINGITKNALKKAEKQLVEGVQPFPMESAQIFNMGYLSGFQAEKRDLEKEDLAQEVNQEVQKYSNDLMRGTVSGYSSVNYKNTRLRTNREEWNYVLLPVWTLTYKGKDGTIYYYAMNGATKKICGKLPVDFKKIAVLFAAIFIPVFIILLIGGYLI